MTDLGMTHSVESKDRTPCEASAAWLDDYVDGELDLARLVEVEAHLESCSVCRGDVEAMQDLLLKVEALSAEQTPPRDLWQGIAPRLKDRPAASEPRPEPVRPDMAQPSRKLGGWRFWAGQAVAACLFLLLGFGAAQWRPGNDLTSPLRLTDGAAAYTSMEGDSLSGTVSPAGLAQGSPSFLVAEAEFLRAKEALLMSALQRREAMSPESLELLYRNLQVIDAATVDLRYALSQDPANPRLEGWVLDNYRRELSLLKRLTSQDA